MLSCARRQVDQPGREKILELADNRLDWDYLERTAKRNYVLPLLYHNLMKFAPEAVPDEVTKSFKKEVNRIITWNKNTKLILLEILDLFMANDIPVVPFKGVTFTILAYGTLALRQTADIDLIVHREDFLKAKDLLVRNGYRHCYFGYHEVRTVQSTLVSDDRKSCVDLHYALTPHYFGMNKNEANSGSISSEHNRLMPDIDTTHWFFYLDSEPMWERLDTMKLNKVDVRIFSQEDQLIITGINGIKENWLTLRRVCDLAEFIRARPDMDWDMILRQVVKLNCKRKFILGLFMAHELLDLPVPEIVQREFKPENTLSYLTSQTLVYICRDKYSHPEFSNYAMIQNLFTFDRKSDWVKFLKYMARRRNNPYYFPARKKTGNQLAGPVTAGLYITRLLVQHFVKMLSQWIRFRSG